METRKTQLTGGSTFTVSLPKEWAKEIGLETGETLRLFPRDRTVVVEPATDDADRWETAVDLGECSGTTVDRLVRALYTAGFDRITFTDTDDLGDEQRALAAAARRYIGLETLESTPAQTTLQSLLDSGTVSIDQSTVQLQQVALSMHSDAVRALLDADVDLAEHVVERDRQVDRLYAMISRHFQRSLVTPRETAALDLDQAELYAYQTTARQLERIGDHAEKVADLATQFERPPSPALADEIESAAASSRQIVEGAASAVVGDNGVAAAHDALDRRDELTTRLTDLERELHEGDVAESHLIALALDSLTRTAEYGGNIAETALQTAARAERL